MSQLPRFQCLFLSCQQKKNTENGAAVTSLRSFLFRDDFSDRDKTFEYSRLYKKLWSLEQFFQTVKGQNDFSKRILYFTCHWMILQIAYIETNNLDV